MSDHCQEANLMNPKLLSMTPRSWRGLSGWLRIALVTSLLLGSHQILIPTEQTQREVAARVSAAFRQLPLLFIENRGQLDSQVAYYLQGRTTTVYFTSTGVTFALSPEQAVTPDDLMKPPLSPLSGVGFLRCQRNILLHSRFFCS
jgi:hypothetical protein